MSILFKSLNVRGLGDDKKRRQLFYKLNTSKYQIFLLQETHSSEVNVQQWRSEWGGDIYFSHGTTASRGTCIMFKKSVNVIIHGLRTDSEGRYIIMDIEIDNLQFTLASVYGPNADDPEFYLNFIETVELLGNDNRIVGGDWNFVLDVNTDKKGGILQTNENAKNIVSAWMNETDLVDIWRESNPDVFKFTWKRLQPHPGIFCRLDFFLVSFGMIDKINKADIIPGFRSDHSAITLSLFTVNNNRGPGYWKLNCSYLRDQDYIQMIQNVIVDTVELNSHADPLLLWDTIKCQIRGASLQFAARKKRSKINTVSALERRLQFLENRLTSLADSTEIKTEIAKVKGELEAYIEEKTKGAMIRSRVRWVEDGEKCTKYFLNLEKRNHNIKTIDRLQLENGTLLTDQKEILEEEKSFYEKLYHTSLREGNGVETIEEFLGNTHDIPKLSEDNKQNISHEITLDEIQLAIKSTSNGKSPGLDGLPIEFYKVFWSNIKDYFIKAMQFSYENGALSFTQKQGLISLIPKKDKSPLLLKNWRPLSLLNADYKILSKIIATRIKTVLPEIIHPDQTGFLKGRYIGENIIKVLNLLEYAEGEQVPALLMLVDYEKAFDSVEWSFVKECLTFFNFGDTIIKWVDILYNNISSCISNNGWFSEFFKPSRGVRQGCPLSPYLFIIVAEIFAISIRKNENIKGITINGETFKIGQFADDTFMTILFEQESLTQIINTLDRFQAISGLKVNYNKTELLRIGSMKDSLAQLYTQKKLKWTSEPTLLLGIKITTNIAELCKLNFDGLVDKLISISKLWNQRHLTLLGRIIIIKSLLVSQLIYKFSVLPTPDTDTLKSVEKVLLDYLWNNKKHFIDKNIIIGDLCNGGLRMVDILSKEISSKCGWVKRLANPQRDIFSGGGWIKLVEYFLPEPGRLFWSGNLKYVHALKLLKHSSVFWENVIKSWCIFNYHEPEEFADILNQQIWFNSQILVNNIPVFSRPLYEKGLIYIKDIVNRNGVISCQSILEKYQLNNNYAMFVNSIIGAIPRTWKTHIYNNRNVNMQNLYINKYDSVISKSNMTKYVYTTLLDKKSKSFPDRLIEKWSIDTGSNINRDYLSNMFKLIMLTTISPKHRAFQFRLIHRILVTNKILHIWKLRDNNLCTFCGTNVETIFHLLWDCTYTQELWNHVYNWIVNVTDANIRFNSQEIILGIDNEEFIAYNAIFVIVKQFIYACRCNNIIPLFHSLLEKIKYYIRVEKYLAIKNNKLDHHTRKWQLFTNI